MRLSLWLICDERNKKPKSCTKEKRGKEVISAASSWGPFPRGKVNPGETDIYSLLKNLQVFKQLETVSSMYKTLRDGSCWVSSEQTLPICSICCGLRLKGSCGCPKFQINFNVQFCTSITWQCTHTPFDWLCYWFAGLTHSDSIAISHSIYLLGKHSRWYSSFWARSVALSGDSVVDFL